MDFFVQFFLRETNKQKLILKFIMTQYECVRVEFNISWCWTDMGSFVSSHSAANGRLVL
jgi:hypothetical protein